MSPAQVLARPVMWCLRGYQLVISPLRPPTCRYYPSCSAYAMTALEQYGLGRGTWMAVRRLLRCHPWSPGGVDHVPLRDAGTGRPIPGTTGPRPLATPGLESRSNPVTLADNAP
jgi:uncharacterized protein